MSISASTLADKNKALTRGLFNGRTVRFPMLFLILMTLILASSVQPTSVKAQAEGGGLEGSPGNCSQRTLNGHYGDTFSGTIVGLGPIAGIGVTNFDGQGHFTGTDTVNINGSGGIRESSTGTYTVNSDCTGSSVHTFPDGRVISLSFVIVNHGKEFLWLNTAPGLVITGSSKKQ